VSAELAGITGPGSAFVAGLITSLHCAGMCGPLACALLPAGRNGADPQTVNTAYHAARLLSYAVLGALLGALGRGPLLLLGSPFLRWAPWLLVVFFVLVALRADQRRPRVRLLGTLYGRFSLRARGARSPVVTAGALGLVTPLLPCGPLYFLLSLALLSGSAARGAETLLAFGLGTVPLLWASQLGLHRVRARLGPVWYGRTQAILALAVAAVLAWRLRGTLGFGAPAAGDFACF
jgi:uncharacterized protein